MTTIRDHKRIRVADDKRERTIAGRARYLGYHFFDHEVRFSFSLSMYVYISLHLSMYMHIYIYSLAERGTSAIISSTTR